MIHRLIPVLVRCAGLCLCVWPPVAFAQITVTDLQTPYSFVSSQSGKEYFISSVNGEPEAADNNGFITKLDANGKLVHLKFIEGGTAGVTLHAPKGMALIGQTLYVADLDHLRAFDITNGKSIATISMPAGTGQNRCKLDRRRLRRDKPVVLLRSTCQSNLSGRTALPEGFHSGRRSGLGRPHGIGRAPQVRPAHRRELGEG